MEQGDKPSVSGKQAVQETQSPADTGPGEASSQYTHTGLITVTPPNETAMEQGDEPSVSGQQAAQETQSPADTGPGEASSQYTHTGLITVTLPNVTAMEQGDKPSVSGKQAAQETQSPADTSPGQMPFDVTAMEQGEEPNVSGQQAAQEAQSPANASPDVSAMEQGEESSESGQQPAQETQRPGKTRTTLLLNSVDELHKTPFKSLTFKQRLEVKRLGPHQPNIAIKQSSNDRGKQFNRHFNPQWFSKKKWLCASVSKEALFCFPCLLYGGDRPWTKFGVTDMKHLPEKIKKHEASTSHIENCLKLAVFGTVGIEPQLRRTFCISIRKHNEEVDKHRHILSKFIDCTQFCAAFELPLCVQESSASSTDRGVYPELVDFAARIDSAMEEHLKTATVFKGSSHRILMELLDCMYDVIRQVIIQQLKETDFVAVQVDEMTDVLIKTQSSLLFRYIHKNTVVERFFAFAALEGSGAETLAANVLENLNLVFPDPDDKKRLISQSYDGASVMRGESEGLQKKVKDLYPNAYPVHCYAHQLGLVMEQVASKIPAVRVFFCSLSSVAKYFAQSLKRTTVLSEVAGRGLARCSPTHWKVHARILKFIFENRLVLLECFIKITCAPGRFDTVTVSKAATYAELLKEVDFLYFVHLFHEIMPHVDKLSTELQRKDIQSPFIRIAMEDFTGCIQRISESVEGIEGKLAKLPALYSHNETDMATLNQTAKQVCDIVMAEAKERFEFSKHLLSATLFASELLPQYRRSFPLDALNETASAYPVLDKERLRTELEVLYRDKEFHFCSGSVDLFSFLVRNNLSEAFKETVTLLKILLTTPMMTSESERCFSTLKKIDLFLKSTKSEDRLNVLAMLSIENQLIGDIPDFNTQVIERFSAQKHRRAHFMYKS
uniref:TTF-type domain-containing protein n=1 Tax=Leptobrachium leishanense TaxID=445787 RepID=A0A8C5PQW2_9ANUR